MNLNLKLLTLILLSFHLTAYSAIVKKPTILALSPHVVELLFAVGAGSQIIATTDFADYPAAAKNIPRVGNYARLQIEKVVKLQPDLIIAWKTGNPVDDLERLQKLGFKVVYSDPKALDDVAKELAYFGELSGHAQQGKKLADEYRQKLAKIRQQYQDKPLLNVFYELWSRPLSTIAKGSWPQLHLDVCRAKNPFYNAVNRYPQVGIEQVLVHDIKLIVVPLSVNQKDKEGFNWQDWQAFSAVKHQQVITPDADLLHRMTPRLLGELDLLCQAIDKSRKYYTNI
ncbi:MAG: vitamin B12 transport system substrate-binding protein [Alteromonadaceae bacterium]